ncbi:MAG: hypothetical protein AB7P69_26965 [Candidatus Binatia bacterium]
MRKTVFDPTVTPIAESTPFTYALRPPSLQGLRVGLVENTKFNSEVILRKIAERLTVRYQVSMTHLEHKKSSGHSVAPETIRLFQQQVDFVLAGVGD